MIKNILFICSLLASLCSYSYEFNDVRKIGNPGCNAKGLVEASTTLLEAISVFSGKVKWEPVCMRHDICYATLGADQNNCDNTFYDHLKGECRNAYPKSYKVVLTLGGSMAARELCYDVANLMYRSVKKFGGSYFSDAKAQTKKLMAEYPTRIFPRKEYVSFLERHPYMMQWYAQNVFDVVYARLGRLPTDLEMYQELEYRFTGKRTTPYPKNAVISIITLLLN